MFEEIPALTVLPFFNLKVDLFYAKKMLDVTGKKYLLPLTSDFLSEENFSRVFMGYNNKSLLFHIQVENPFEEVNKVDYRKGDSIEIFIDTRDVKDKSFVSQFCHHFVFFAEKVDGFLGKEVTRFRTEEVHSLCSPKDLIVTPHFAKKSYILDIEINASALFGYEPISFDRIGFAYRINRKNGSSQHFTVSSLEYKIEQQPSLWASLKLCK